MLQWTDKFETGHGQIDSQHKLLISYINHLESMARTTNPCRREVEFMLNLVDFIENYIAVHFRNEESCMLRYRCPAHAENKNAHEQFLKFFQQFKQRFDAEGCRPEVLQELHEACRVWIQGHILHIDVQLRPCLSGGPEPEERA